MPARYRNGLHAGGRSNAAKRAQVKVKERSAAEAKVTTFRVLFSHQSFKDKIQGDKDADAQHG